MVFGHEPPADRKAFLRIRQRIHAADTVIAGHGKKDQRPWFGLKTVGHLKVQFPVFSLSGVVDDEFSSPIVIPSVVKVRDQRDATKGRKRLRAPVAAFGMVLVGLPFNRIIYNARKGKDGARKKGPETLVWAQDSGPPQGSVSRLFPFGRCR